MLLFLIIVSLVGGLAVGLIANNWVRPYAKTEVQGVKLELLVAPMLTLTVLLLSFLLVQVFVSYTRTRDSAAEEAGKISTEFDTFGYLDRSYALPAQTALICFTRATTNLEWALLEDDAVFSDEVTRWGRMLDPVLGRLAAERPEQPYGSLLTVDKERLDARRKRVVEAEPAVPSLLQIMLVVLSAVAIGVIAAFTLPHVSRRVQIGALVALAIALAAMQWAILELDEKFSGLIKIEPTYLDLVDEQLSARWERMYPDATLPCDAEGRPVMSVGS